MKRNSRTLKIKQIQELKQKQKNKYKNLQVIEISHIVLKNLNEPLVSLTHKLQLISANV